MSAAVEIAGLSFSYPNADGPVFEDARLAIEEGAFVYVPDGRLQYQITAGPSAGQQGVNRIVYQGQSFAMYRPNGSYITYQRQASQPQPQPGPAPPPSKGAGSLPDRALSSCATSSATANTSSTNATAPSCRAAPSR